MCMQELTFAKAIIVVMETEEAAKVAKETVYSTGQNKLYVIYYSVTVPRSDRYRVVLRMQRNVNVQFNKTFSSPATV